MRSDMLFDILTHVLTMPFMKESGPNGVFMMTSLPTVLDLSFLFMAVAAATIT